MLAVMEDVGAAMEEESKSKKGTKKSKAVKMPALIDTAYAGLSCELELVKGDELAMVKAYCDNTQGYRKCRVVHAFKAERGGEAERYAAHEDVGNRKLLWHGACTPPPCSPPRSPPYPPPRSPPCSPTR